MDAKQLEDEIYGVHSQWWCDVLPHDAPLNSLKDSNVGPKVNAMEGIGICSLTYNILGVRGACWSFGMGIKMNDKQVNYYHELAQTK
jgi:hypothetical protein